MPTFGYFLWEILYCYPIIFFSISFLQSGKLVATVAPTTTLPHLGQSHDQKHSHHRQHHEDNTLPQLNKQQTSDSNITRQNSFSTTGTPDRAKRDQYGNKLPMTPQGQFDKD